MSSGKERFSEVTPFFCYQQSNSQICWEWGTPAAQCHLIFCNPSNGVLSWNSVLRVLTLAQPNPKRKAPIIPSEHTAHPSTGAQPHQCRKALPTSSPLPASQESHSSAGSRDLRQLRRNKTPHLYNCTETGTSKTSPSAHNNKPGSPRVSGVQLTPHQPRAQSEMDWSSNSSYSCTWGAPLELHTLFQNCWLRSAV